MAGRVMLMMLLVRVRREVLVEMEAAVVLNDVMG